MQPLTLRQAFRRWWQARCAEHGTAGAAMAGIREGAQYLWSLTPGERRKRFGDLDFDFEHSTDTTHANIGWREELIARLAGTRYYPTEPYLFEEIIAALPLAPEERKSFTFIDLGAGKGRTLLLAAQHGFGKIVGVELLPELHAIAEANARKWSAAHGTAEIELVNTDAAEYEFPIAPMVIYLFNPFPRPVLEHLLQNLHRSLQQLPREIYIAYRYPEMEVLLERQPWLRKVGGDQQWVIFTAISDKQ